jgi:hypothetical protein
MVDSQQGPKYDLRRAQFAGGMAETVQGDQIGGTLNNYGVKLEDIAQLLSNLREQAQAFPPEYKADALDILDDLDTDCKRTTSDPSKIGRRLKRLIAIASTVGAIAGGVATFSGNLKDFTSNVAELAEVLEIPVEAIQSVAVPDLTTE